MKSGRCFWLLYRCDAIGPDDSVSSRIHRAISLTKHSPAQIAMIHSANVHGEAQSLDPIEGGLAECTQGEVRDEKRNKLRNWGSEISLEGVI